MTIIQKISAVPLSLIVKHIYDGETKFLVVKLIFIAHSTAPKIFSIFFNICKLILNKNTIDKIRIFGHDEMEWKAALLEEIDADQLPVYYGGTMTDPDGDPKCPSKFNMGGEVPHEYYLSNSLPEPKEGMETLNVIAGASGFKSLKFKVEIANSTLR